MGQMLNLVEEFNTLLFQNELLSWYKKNKRELPWRKSNDPYEIWVSEIMLQQTRVETVIPYYERFLEQFPTIAALADAKEEAVLKAWEGLGYYSRARNLQTAVREVQQSYGGVVPNNEDDILTLKGIGPYTAGAILSIAYGKPVPAVDGNVMRVLARIFLVQKDITKAKTRKLFERIIRELIPNEAASDFNQALMELGALICTPQAPACLLCPVQNECQAFSNGMQAELPVRPKKKRPRRVYLAVVVLRDENGRYYVQRRPSEGLLANLWEFPNCEVNKSKNVRMQLQQYLQSEYNFQSVVHGQMMQFHHLFSHIRWELTVFTGEIQSKVIAGDGRGLMDLQAMERLPFSVSQQKIMEELHTWNSD